jgi:hypothetical protein
MFHETVRDNGPRCSPKNGRMLRAPQARVRLRVWIIAKRIEQKVAKNAKTIWVHWVTLAGHPPFRDLCGRARNAFAQRFGRAFCLILFFRSRHEEACILSR